MTLLWLCWVLSRGDRICFENYIDENVVAMSAWCNLILLCGALCYVRIGASAEELLILYATTKALFKSMPT